MKMTKKKQARLGWVRGLYAAASYLGCGQSTIEKRLKDAERGDNSKGGVLLAKLAVREKGVWSWRGEDLDKWGAKYGIS